MSSFSRRALIALVPAGLLSAITPLAQAAGREEARLITAAQVLEELRASPDTAVPDRLLQRAHAIAVVPDVIKIGFGLGGRRGRGVLTVRDAQGRFGNPAFITLTGGSIGWQIGAQSTDVVLVFTTARSLDAISEGKVTLGADASVAAGPVGRQASAGTDETFAAEVYSYSRNRGLFAGVALDGSAILMDKQANAAFYDTPAVAAADILNGKVVTSSPTAARFVAVVQQQATAPAAEPAPTPAAAATPATPVATGGEVKVYPLESGPPATAKPPN